MADGGGRRPDRIGPGFRPGRSRCRRRPIPGPQDEIRIPQLCGPDLLSAGMYRPRSLPNRPPSPLPIVITVSLYFQYVRTYVKYVRKYDCSNPLFS